MSVENFFFTVVQKHLDKVIVQEFGAAMGRMFALVGAISITIFTLWFIYQGWRIMTGKSRAPLMDLMMDSLRTVAILGLLTGSGMILASNTGTDVLSQDHMIHAGGGKSVADTKSSVVGSAIAGIRRDITWLVTGSDKDVYAQIDENLKNMQAILTSINTINTAGDPALEDTKRTAMFLSGFGQASPSMVAGGLVLLNEISLWIGCMLGPLFTLMLLFDATKAFFWRWVNIMVSLLFSLAILAVMSKICVGMAGQYALAVMGAKFLSLFTGGPSLMSTAMQQGGLGLLLTTLLITVPPSVANFFQATIGGIGQSWFNPTSGEQRKEFAASAGGGQRASGDTDNTADRNRNRDSNQPSLANQHEIQAQGRMAANANAPTQPPANASTTDGIRSAAESRTGAARSQPQAGSKPQDQES